MLTDKFLTLPQVSDETGIPLASVYWYHQKGTLKTEKIFGSLVVSQTNFDEFMTGYKAIRSFRKAGSK